MISVHKSICSGGVLLFVVLEVVQKSRMVITTSVFVVLIEKPIWQIWLRPLVCDSKQSIKWLYIHGNLSITHNILYYNVKTMIDNVLYPYICLILVFFIPSLEVSRKTLMAEYQHFHHLNLILYCFLGVFRVYWYVTLHKSYCEIMTTLWFFFS